MQVFLRSFPLCGLAVAAATMMFAIEGASAQPGARDPLRINVPSRPLLPNTTEPVLFRCSDLEDCQKQAKAACEGFNYPNGKILFLELAPVPRPFPIYNVICFD